MGKRGDQLRGNFSLSVCMQASRDIAVELSQSLGPWPPTMPNSGMPGCKASHRSSPGVRVVAVKLYFKTGEDVCKFVTFRLHTRAVKLTRKTNHQRVLLDTGRSFCETPSHNAHTHVQQPTTHLHHHLC